MMKKTDKLISALALFITVGFFAVFAVINFYGLEKFIDGDMYADMLVARHIWEQKTLFPEGWVFGNQYYVVATPVVAALFYGICGSMNLAMNLATTLMSLFIIVSFFYMLRPFVKRESELIFALLALVAAVIVPNAMREAEGQLFFTLASYYACYLITLFVVFGDYVRAVQGKHGRRIGVLLLAAFLSFCTGMQSIRQTLIMVMPIICVEILLTVWRRLRKEKALNPASLMRCAVYTLSNLAGYALMLALKIPSTTIYGSAAPDISGSMSEKILSLWHAVSLVSGFDFLRGDFSKLCIFHFVLFVGVIAAAFILIIKRVKHAPSPLAVLWLLLAAGICGVFAAGLLFAVAVRPIYIFMWYPLAAVSFLIVYEALAEKPRTLLALALCLVSLWNLFFSYGDNVKKAVEPTDDDITALVDWCAENDIRYLYGQWESAPVFAVCSDDRLTAACWDGYYFETLRYINEPNVYSEEDNSAAVYLVHDYDWSAVQEYAAALGASLEHIGTFCGYEAFTSSIQLLR